MRMQLPLFTTQIMVMLMFLSYFISNHDNVHAFVSVFVPTSMMSMTSYYYCPCSCDSSGRIGILHKTTTTCTQRNLFQHRRKNPVLRANQEDGVNTYRRDELPLNQIFQKAVMLQRSGDRIGSLEEYKQFLKVAESYDVDPSLYAEVHANMGAIYAMQGKGSEISIEVKTNLRLLSKDAFQKAVQYRPSLGSSWVNLALLVLAEGKEFGNSLTEQSQIMHSLKEARQCCERALGMDNEDERSRSLANKLIGDIDSMIRQMKK